MQNFSCHFSADSERITIMADGQEFHAEHDGAVFAWAKRINGFNKINSIPICLVEVISFDVYANV